MKSSVLLGFEIRLVFIEFIKLLETEVVLGSLGSAGQRFKAGVGELGDLLLLGVGGG